MEDWIHIGTFARIAGVTVRTVNNARLRGQIEPSMVRSINGKTHIHAQLAAAAMGRTLTLEDPEESSPAPGVNDPARMQLESLLAFRGGDDANPTDLKAERSQPGGKAATPTSVLLNRSRLKESEERAKLLELERRRKEGELVPAEMALAAQAQVARRVVGAVLSVPSRFRAETPHVSREDAARLKEMLREALEEVSGTS